MTTSSASSYSSPDRQVVCKQIIYHPYTTEMSKLWHPILRLEILLQILLTLFICRYWFLALSISFALPRSTSPFIFESGYELLQQTSPDLILKISKWLASKIEELSSTVDSALSDPQVSDIHNSEPTPNLPIAIGVCMITLWSIPKAALDQPSSCVMKQRHLKVVSTRSLNILRSSMRLKYHEGRQNSEIHMPTTKHGPVCRVKKRR